MLLHLRLYYILRLGLLKPYFAKKKNRCQNFVRSWYQKKKLPILFLHEYWNCIDQSWFSASWAFKLNEGTVLEVILFSFLFSGMKLVWLWTVSLQFSLRLCIEGEIVVFRAGTLSFSAFCLRSSRKWRWNSHLSTAANWQDLGWCRGRAGRTSEHSFINLGHFLCIKVSNWILCSP